EPDPRREGRRHEPARQLERRDIAVQVRDMAERRELVTQDFGEVGAAMTERSDSQPGGEVEVLLAVGVPNVAALAPGQNEARILEDTGQPLRLVRIRIRAHDVPPTGVSRSEGLCDSYASSGACTRVPRNRSNDVASNAAMRTSPTPPETAARAARSFGIMPPVATPDATSPSMASTSISFCHASSTDTPSTSDKSRSRVAPSATAIAAADSSALTLSG